MYAPAGRLGILLAQAQTENIQAYWKYEQNGTVVFW